MFNKSHFERNQENTILTITYRTEEVLDYTLAHHICNGLLTRIFTVLPLLIGAVIK
jgi:hypothetical protein